MWLVTPAAAADVPPPVDLVAAARAISDTLRAHVYDPAELASERYDAIRRETEQLAARAAGPEDFVSQFNAIWQDAPFSHVRLVAATRTAEQMADYLDTMNVGGQGALLEWRGDTAVLTVNTMMGLDTIEQIDDAYRRIVEKRAGALIIDLRSNDGGAFAVKPLVGHVIRSDLDAGAFLSQQWALHNAGVPTRETILTLPPWRGWSIKAFWNDVQQAAITRITFVPTAPTYDGPIFVLTSGRTASAAELAVDALMATGRATVIGERTAGQMLSQKPYDLAGGMQLFLPIADYVSLRSGRIEGRGIAPDIATGAGAAMAAALQLAAGAAAR